MSRRSLLLLTAAALLARSAATLSLGWSAIAPLPFSRSDHTATTVGGLIYIAGGCNGAQNCAAGVCACSSFTADVTAYSPARNTYTPVAPMPTPRYRHLACSLGAVIYIFGGRDLTTDAIITSVDAYNTSSATWSTLATAYPSELGSDNSCSTMGEAIYVFGGYSPDYSASLATIYSFSPATVSWTRMAGSLSQGRGDFASVALGSSIYIYGGYAVPDFCRPLDSTEVYTPATDSITPGPALPTRLAEKDDGVVVNGAIVSFGGETKSTWPSCDDTKITPLRGVYSLMPAAGAVWANETQLPDSRMRFAAAEAGGTAYVFGGQGPLMGTSLPILYSALSYVAPPAAADATVPYLVFAGAIAGAVLATAALAAAVLVLRARYKSGTFPFGARSAAPKVGAQPLGP